MTFVDQPIVGGKSPASVEQAVAYLLVMHPIHLKSKGLPRVLGDVALEEIARDYWFVSAYQYPEVDPGLAFAQACHETGCFTFGNQVPVGAKNPAGIGAINDGKSYIQYVTWLAGIRAQFVHLLAWAGDTRGQGDPRYPLILAAAKKLGWAKSWRALGGRWAVPGGGYGEQIEAQLAAILATKVPEKTMPKTTDYSATIGNYGYAPNRNNRNGHAPVAIVLHIMDGTMGSTLNWFRNPASQASAGWGIAKNGDRAIYVQDEHSPWTNGDIQKPDLTIPWLKWCIDNDVNPNEVCVTIECEGHTGEVYPEPQYQAVLQTCREETAKWGIAISSQAIVGHYRLNSVTRANCPGSTFPWERLFKDLGQQDPAHGLSALLWAAYNDEIAENDQRILGNVLYEATADLSGLGLSSVAQCLVMEKSVMWTDGKTVDFFHRGQYEGLVAAGKVSEWK